MIDLDELERLYRDQQDRGLYSEALTIALRNAAPELIAMARQAEALHTAMCQAVALLNVCPDIAMLNERRAAHAILRQTLIDYADAMQEKP